MLSIATYPATVRKNGIAAFEPKVPHEQATART
ncbi:hypothetical protein ABIB08_009112 [Bradyrhizobium sp. RT11b]